MLDDNPFVQPNADDIENRLTEEEQAKKDEEERQGLPSNVNVEIANAPMNLDNAVRSDPNNKYIKYVGVGTVRDMTPDDWERVGVDDLPRFFQWNYLNKMRIPMSAFTDKALTYMLREDGRFVIVELDDNGNEIEN